jgi:hypothetical protein
MVAGWSIEELSDQARRADTKAGHLLGLFSLLAAATTAVAAKAGLPLAATVVLWVSVVPLLAALVVLLVAVRPATAGAPFERYAVWTAGVIADDYRALAADLLVYQADRAHDHAVAVVRKFRAIRRAVHLVLLGGTGLVVAGGLLVLLGGY